VFALGEDRVLRVLDAGASREEIEERQDLVRELGTRGAPFLLPEVLEVSEVEGRWFTVERRLPGRPVSDQLAIIEGPERELLVEHHLDAAAALGSLHLGPRGWFGELIGDDAVRASSWRAYLRDRAARSLRASTMTAEVAHVRPALLAEQLPDTAAPSFVHLDAFAGNMLAVGSTITSVIDFGRSCVVGDARLDPLSVAVYLSSREITPTATARDVEVARSWLRSAGLDEWFEPARNWLAAFWSFATDDQSLWSWCRAVLFAH
jgi:Ser/Thr protein kinase RdoA (MazF antagonist)